MHELFRRIARRYDLLNDVLSLGAHRRWKRRVVELANRAGPGWWLDLCCGSGDIAWRTPGMVVGVDFTEEMLRVARARSLPNRKAQPYWVRADALRLPFADASFAAVTIGYGLRNLADLEAGLREILRVLQPAGWLVALDFGIPPSRLLRQLYFAHLALVVPLAGALVAGNRAAYAYIRSSLRSYPGQHGVREMMIRLGYQDCGVEEFCGGAMAINFGRKPA